AHRSDKRPPMVTMGQQPTQARRLQGMTGFGHCTISKRKTATASMTFCAGKAAGPSNTSGPIGWIARPLHRVRLLDGGSALCGPSSRGYSPARKSKELIQETEVKETSIKAPLGRKSRCR